MASQHSVRQGECMATIGAAHGFDWQTLWNHPNNAALKARRKTPHVLFLGDLVFIPDPRQNPVARPTDKHHRFVMRGVPSIVRIRLRDELDRPRKGIAYDFRVGDDRRSGTTDDNGELKEPVSPADVEAFLAFGEGDARQEVCLRIGNLDPVEEVSGMQARLANLGLNVGDVDGILGPVTTSALSDFQVQVGLEPTGEADEATRAKLTNLHGC